MRIFQIAIHPRQLGALLVFFFTLSAFESFAISNSREQYTFRLASISGSFSGVEASGAFSVMPSIDAEYETFRSSRHSWAARFSFAYQTSEGKAYYVYYGIGERYYFGSASRPFLYTEGDMTIEAQPKYKYYIGWDGGISNVLVKALRVYSITSTNLDIGANFGFQYYFNSNLSGNFGITYSFAQGFTAIAVKGTVMKIYSGVNF